MLYIIKECEWQDQKRANINGEKEWIWENYSGYRQYSPVYTGEGILDEVMQGKFY